MKYEDYIERKAPRLPVVLLRVFLGIHFIIAAAFFLDSGLADRANFEAHLHSLLIRPQLPFMQPYARLITHLPSGVFLPTLTLAGFVLIGTGLLLGLYTRTFAVLGIIFVLHPYLLGFHGPTTNDTATLAAHQAGMRLTELLVVTLAVTAVSGAGRTAGLDGLVWRRRLRREFAVPPTGPATTPVTPAPPASPQTPQPIPRRVTGKTAGRVFVTRPIPEPGLKLLRDAGLTVEVNPRDEVLSAVELQRAVRGRDAVLCLLTDRVDAAALEAATEAEVFANFAVGYDNIDVQAATGRGILVTNTPGVLTEAVADLTWALLLAAGRRVIEADRFVRQGKFRVWGPMSFLGADLSGRTLGVVGAGRIGSAVARRSSGFGMKVLYDDLIPNESLERELGARRVELDQLVSEADFISLHVNFTEATRGLLGPQEFKRMKSNVVLVNTARGPVMDEQALVEFLRTHPDAAAGLDVYEKEPQLSPGLVELPNVVLLPHIASATVRTRARMAEMAARNILSALEGHKPANLVNPQAIDVRRASSVSGST